jgi:hypothetical protein
MGMKDSRVLERRIRGAARRLLGLTFFTTYYEGGQWWVLTDTAGRRPETYAVVDAIGPGSDDGFAFRKVGGFDVDDTGRAVFAVHADDR